VVHCAGGLPHTGDHRDCRTRLRQSGTQQFQSLFWLPKDAAPHLAKRRGKGRIIFISSGEGQPQSTPNSNPHGSQQSLIECVRSRVLPSNFGAFEYSGPRVEPGLIGNGLIYESTLGEDYPTCWRNIFRFPRLGQSADIAQAVLFPYLKRPGKLQSPAPSCLVDGGTTMVALTQDRRNYLKKIIKQP